MVHSKTQLLFPRSASLRPVFLMPVAAIAAFFLPSCGGGGGGGGTPGTSGDFVVLRTEPAPNGTIFLNEALRIDFSNRVSLSSADFSSVTFTVFDLTGNQVAESVSGSFRLATSPGDTTPGRRLEFLPRFPLSDSFDDGGFRPGRRYLVQLAEGDPRLKLGLQDMAQKGLAAPISFAFTTANGTTPSQLFRDTKVGGPRRKSFAVSPRDPITQRVTLNELGQSSVEVRLEFDQPLNPSRNNVPTDLDTDPLRRAESAKGRIFLEYDDRDRQEVWIPADVELVSNDLSGAVVVLRPLGILPNNANIRVVVEKELADMSGEANQIPFNRVFAEFQTDASYELGFDAVVEDFLSETNLDLTAPFLEPLAEVVPGGVRANFDFEGSRTNLDYEPTSPEVELNTNFTTITPKGAPAINVSGGQFKFRNVTINEGVTVRATGSNPMVWLVTGNFVVNGDLLVEGGEGQSVNTLASANFPSASGSGFCGGGSGGQGSPVITDFSPRGQTGFGPGQVAGGGGQGGLIDCFVNDCGKGSGGGGGSMATQGDPNYVAKASGNSFQQQLGTGGQGCDGPSGNRKRPLDGGRAGPGVFSDTRKDNDFWGLAVDLRRQLRISGELSQAVGGAGGGGGGDYSRNGCTPGDPNFISAEKGGGGGGGGGVLIIKALGRVRVGANGTISVNGGNGGGGAFAGANDVGGGGGGGSGGMLVIMAGRSIDLVEHGISDVDGVGATYGDGDYDFSLSADGAAAVSGTNFNSSSLVFDKYNPAPRRKPSEWSATRSQRDERPMGAFGGMGIIQLMAPPGDPASSTDGTNTVLDDNIRFFIGDFNGSVVTGRHKQRLLGWRGLFNPQSQEWQDDVGNLISLDDGDDPSTAAVVDPLQPGDNEGDMRPSPILLPAPFGSRSRMRSKWIDLGRGVVRAGTSLGGDGQSRGVEAPTANALNLAEGLTSVSIGDSYGPVPEFSGTFTSVDNPSDPASTVDSQGFVRFKRGAGSPDVDYTTVIAAPITVTSLTLVDDFKGQPAYRLTLAPGTTSLTSTANRFAHYSARLQQTGQPPLGDFRILGHSATTLYLSRNDGVLDPGLVNLSFIVVARFFDIVTNGSEGFVESYLSEVVTDPNSGLPLSIPKANVRVGFAFHMSPAQPALEDDPLGGAQLDRNRIPNKLGTYLFDLQTAMSRDAVRMGGFGFMQWDLLFDSSFKVDTSDEIAVDDFGPDSPIVEVRRLTIPYRY